MQRALLVGLVVLVCVQGCVNPHAKRPAADARPGGRPTTSEVRYDATYALIRTDRPGEPLHTTHLLRGEHVGFRRESNGSLVAVAADKSFPLGDEAYAWILTEENAPSWRERAAQDCKRIAGKTGGALALAGLVIATIVVMGAYGFASGLPR